MPRATCKYRFEWTIVEWAGRLSQTLTGNPHFPFLLLLDAAGVARQLAFGSAPETHDENEWNASREGAAAWLCYDPFEGPEYTYLSWEGVEQRTMERLVGTAFAPEDLTSDGETIAFPTRWGVMF